MHIFTTSLWTTTVLNEVLQYGFSLLLKILQIEESHVGTGVEKHPQP